ncbi:MAG: peptidoglycan-binding protein, partial [Syntrophaceae bacterium]
GIADVKPRSAAFKKKVMAGAGLTAAALAAAIGVHVFGPDLWEPLRPTAPIAATTPAPAPVSPAQRLEAALSGLTGEESARGAFNVLARLWNSSPVDEAVDPQSLEGAARQSGFSLHRFSGNLGALLRLDSPAILELRLPGIEGKRWAALMGMKDGQILVDSPPAGKGAISTVELERYWTGRALILWKNPLDIPVKVPPGASGRHVRDLQGLLARAGATGGQATGRYDRQTIEAVRDFQSARGIEPDGVAGQQTLILLYRVADPAATPGLVR